MSRFFVGQRVRKRAGLCVGLTGRIKQLGVGFRGDWMLVTIDSGCIGRYETWPAGSNPSTEIREWDPILPDGHHACDEEFKRDLDKLLECLPA